MTDTINQVREALELARDTFSRYEDLHRQKGTEEGDRKAASNAAVMLRMQEALSLLSQPEPDAPGAEWIAEGERLRKAKIAAENRLNDAIENDEPTGAGQPVVQDFANAKLSWSAWLFQNTPALLAAARRDAQGKEGWGDISTAPLRANAPDWRALASRLNGLHAQMFGISSMDDPALAMQAIKDGGVLHEAVHDCLRALPAALLSRAKEQP